jgi:hypothetical protein
MLDGSGAGVKDQGSARLVFANVLGFPSLKGTWRSMAISSASAIPGAHEPPPRQVFSIAEELTNCQAVQPRKTAREVCEDQVAERSVRRTLQKSIAIEVEVERERYDVPTENAAWSSRRVEEVRRQRTGLTGGRQQAQHRARAVKLEEKLSCRSVTPTIRSPAVP